MEALLSLFEPSPAHGRQRRCDNIGKSYIDTYMTTEKINNHTNKVSSKQQTVDAKVKGRRKRRGRKNKVAPVIDAAVAPSWDESPFQDSTFPAENLGFSTCEEDVMTWNHARGSHDLCDEINENISDWDADSRSWWDEASESNERVKSSFRACQDADSDGDCSMDADLDSCYARLPPEPQAGNVEYKLQLLDISDVRFERLVSQLKWRLREGGGRAIYVVGVQDSGAALGLPHSEVRRSLSALEDMARRLNARARIVVARAVANKRIVLEIEVVVLPPALRWCGTARVALLGANDSGKSSLAGVLSGGSLDNGRGRARLNVFRHVHEVRSGRTSSLSHAVLRYDSNGKPLYQTDIDPDRLVSLLDVAGHRKYLRTTTYGLTCWRPHAALLCLPASSLTVPTGCLQGAEQHARLALALNVPLIVAVTKCDLGDLNQLVLERIRHFLDTIGCKKELRVIDTPEQAAVQGALVHVGSDSVPVLAVSSVSGLGLVCLHSLLHSLPATKARQESNPSKGTVEDEFQVDEVFTVGGRAVVAGLVSKGIVRAAQKGLLGPLEDGSFAPVVVTEVWCLGAPARGARAGHAASLALSLPTRATPRRGMVLLSQSDAGQTPPRGCLYFQALVRIVQHSGAICPGFQAMLHADNVRQTVVVEAISGGVLKAGGPARRILLRLGSRPEYLVPGKRILLTDGHQTTAVGEITAVDPC